jgi:hypothetical protein
VPAQYHLRHPRVFLGRAREELELGVEPFLEREVEHDVCDVLARLFRDREDRTALERAILLELHRAHDDLLPLHQTSGHPRAPALRLRRGLAHGRAALRIAERRDPIIGAQPQHHVPHVHVVEERRLLEREARVVRDRAQEIHELAAPAPRPGDEIAGVRVESQEEHRTAALHRHVEQVNQVALVGVGGALRQDLDDAAIELAERAPERHALLVRREARRHRLAGGPAVCGRIRRAPAPAARIERFAQQALHRRDLVGGRRAVPRGFAHRLEPQRVVADERDHVDPEPDVDGVEVVAEALPAPLDDRRE